MERTTAALTMALAAAALRAAVPASAQVRAPFTVVDSLGRKVAVPGRVERIISLEPEVTRIIVALGAGEKLVGIDYFLRHRDLLFPIVFPGAAGLPVVSNQGQDLNYEEAVSLAPDVIFASPSEFRTAETIAKKTRLPVAALASMGRFADLLAEIDTLGRIVGREARAAELKAYFSGRVEALRTAASKPRAGPAPVTYISFWGSLLRTPVSYDPVDAAGGRNIAAGLLPSYLGTASTTVSLEQILRWDPEVILVHGNYLPSERLVTVESVLKDPRLASVRAVRNGRVHYTFGFWYWWDPALVLVETAHLTRLFHPGSMPGFDLVREGDEIFRSFYGAEGLFTSLSRVLECHDWTP
jgi:iron complex transport system substrate-binding protein